MYFVNKLYLNYQNYHTNENIRDENYKGKFLFPMKDFVSFGTYRPSFYFMSTRFLKHDIDGVRVPQFKLA